ncbi:MAG TPA: hypothetical protein VFH61_07930 [Thermoleophilia bacterium]|nr:hypothetical protein [Thermoleophilia bacterium]
MKQWTLPLVLGAVGLVALAAGFGASRATATAVPRTSSSAQDGSAGCERLMSDPVAVKAMQPLHAEHVKDMQAWQAQYGTDPQSAEAQAALKTMRQEHVREMRAAFKELGIKVPAEACDPSMMDSMNGTGMMDGEADGMMGGAGATGDAHQQHHSGGSAGPSGASGMMGGAPSGSTF